MSEELEEEIYYAMCKISKICRQYFFERKYSCMSCVSLNKTIESINEYTRKLNKNYQELKKNKGN